MIRQFASGDVDIRSDGYSSKVEHALICFIEKDLTDIALNRFMYKNIHKCIKLRPQSKFIINKWAEKVRKHTEPAAMVLQIIKSDTARIVMMEHKTNIICSKARTASPSTATDNNSTIWSDNMLRRPIKQDTVRVIWLKLE